MSAAKTPLSPGGNSRGVICYRINSSTSVQTSMSQRKYFIAAVTLGLFACGRTDRGRAAVLNTDPTHSCLRDFDPLHPSLKHPELCRGRKDKGWEDQGQGKSPAARERPANLERNEFLMGRDGIIYLLVGVWGSGRLMNQVNKANFQPSWGNLENVV